MPPLRDRRGDLPDLVAHFAGEVAFRHALRAPTFSRTTRRAPFGHAWPGNVRELRNAVERAALLREGKVVRPEDLELPEQARPPRPALTFDPAEGLDVIVTRAIQSALDATDGSTDAAARMLGVSVRTVQRAVATGKVVRSGR